MPVRRQPPLAGARRSAQRARAAEVGRVLILLDTRGVTVERLAASLDVSPRSIRRWWHGEALPQAGNFGRLRRLAESA